MRQLMKQYYVIIIIIITTILAHTINSLYVGASVEKKTYDLDMSLIRSIMKRSVAILTDTTQTDRQT